MDVERAELDVLQGVAQDDWLPNPTLSLNLGPSVSGFLTRPLRCNLFKKPLMSAPSQAKPGSVAPGFMHQARPPCARTDRGGGRARAGRRARVRQLVVEVHEDGSGRVAAARALAGRAGFSACIADQDAALRGSAIHLLYCTRGPPGAAGR